MLRMSLMAGAFEGALIPEAAEQLLASWRADGVDVVAAPGHLVARRVGKALVTGTYAGLGGSLLSVIDPRSLGDLKGSSQKLVNRMKMTIDIRRLVAATVTAFRTYPGKRFSDPRVRANILSTAERNQDRGFRGETPATSAARPEEATQPTKGEFDRLWEVLSRA